MNEVSPVSNDNDYALASQGLSPRPKGAPNHPGSSGTLQLILTILIVVAGAGAAWVMYGMKKPPEKKIPERFVPLVRVLEPEARTVDLKVRVHGSVLPRTATTLVPQVSGRVVEVAPSFEDGGFFKEGDVLVTIDPTDYRLALAQAETRVAQADARVVLEEAQAKLAREEWEAFGKGDADPLVLREPQLAEARATLASATVAVDQAKLSLERTSIRAPFDGRVRMKHVDVGQFVALGTPMAGLYAVDFAEVKLPIPSEEVRFLNLPLGGLAGSEGPEVTLRARVGGTDHAWKGRIVRTGAEIDPRTRMIHAVGRVENPYAEGRTPLMVGLFVRAEIRGHAVEGVRILPREAVHAGSMVWLVDRNRRLVSRQVDVLRYDGGDALIRSGLGEGDRVVLSRLDAPSKGMEVRIHEEAPE